MRACASRGRPNRTPLLSVVRGLVLCLCLSVCLELTPHASVASTVGPATAGARGEGDVGGERMGERTLPLRGLAHTLSGSVTCQKRA